MTLAPMLGTTPGHVSNSLTIRQDYARAKSGEHIATLVLPDDFAANPAQQEAITDLMTKRFGVEVKPIWQTQKHPMTLVINRAPIPPKMVKFADMMATIRKLPSKHIALGVTGQGELKVWDVGSAEPHFLAVATSRRGKTRLLILILAQLIFQGAEKVVVLDPKMVGVDEALAAVPGVEVYNNPRNVQQMIDAVHGFRLFMEERITKFADDRTISFREAVLCIDEFSFWAAQVKELWDEERTKSQPARHPVFRDINAILWQGAQFNCRIMLFGQRVDYNMLGPSLESFGTKLMSGWTRQSYMRLIGITPMPIGSRQRGRFLYFDSEEIHMIQVILGSDFELREFALEYSEKQATTQPINHPYSKVVA
jgi:hypothetical protein